MIQLIIEAVKPIADAAITSKSDTLEILTKVNEFYDYAWNKLIVMGTFVLTIVGIIVPIIIQRYQDKILSVNEQKLEKRIIEEIEDAKIKIQEQLKEEFDKKIEEQEDKTHIRMCIMSGFMTHTQANLLAERKLYYSALGSYIVSLNAYVAGDDQNNVIKVLEEIEDCLNKLTSEETEKFKFLDFLELRERLEYTLEKYGKLTVFFNKVTDIKKKLASF